MKTTLFTLLLILLSISLQAQITYEERLEIKLKNGYAEEEIFEFGEKGFLLRTVSTETTLGEEEWKYDFYDNKLKLIHTESIHLPRTFWDDEDLVTDTHLRTLYKNKKSDFLIISIDIDQFKIEQIEGKLPKKSGIREMAILGDYAYFRASFKKAPYLFSINLKTGKQKQIPVIIKGIKPKNIGLDHFQLLEESNEIFLYTNVKIKKKEGEMYVIRLNDQGEKQEVFHLTKNIAENIIDATAFPLGEGKYAFTGSYATNSRFSAEGIFFCKAQKSEIEQVEFHKFLDLKNFLEPLSAKEKKKIIRKKSRKESKGKELQYNRRLAVHDIITSDDGYILIGEAYYPVYRTEHTTTTSIVNGVTTTSTIAYSVFDGYQYTHGIIVKFGLEGGLIWDETFEMWPSYRPFFIKRLITIEEQNDETIKMAFANRSKIVSKIIDYDGEVIKDKESDPIETNFEGDITKRSYSSLNHWYDNYFLAYGNQKIKNKEEKSVKKRRKVYFISKIRYE